MNLPPNTKLKPQTQQTTHKRTHLMNTYILNTGQVDHMDPDLKGLPPQTLADLRKLLQTDAMLLDTPIGQLEYQSRRRGSSLEFAIAKDHIILAEHAVSREGQNRSTWDAIMARYHQFRQLGAISNRSPRCPQPPANSPWCAMLVHPAWCLLTPLETEKLAVLQAGLTAGFILHLDAITPAIAN